MPAKVERIFNWGGGGGGGLRPGHEFVGGSGAILPQKILKSKCRPVGGGGGEGKAPQQSLCASGLVNQQS